MACQRTHLSDKSSLVSDIQAALFNWRIAISILTWPLWDFADHVLQNEG